MTKTNSWSFAVHDKLPVSDAQRVDAGIEEFNNAAAPLDQVRSLSCFARLPSGEVVGGALGRTWGACCELQQLWVQECQRRSGLGTRLVRLFEEQAAMRGCQVFYLETFSFQAYQFYRSLGYVEKLTIRGYPEEIIKYVMFRNQSCE